MFSFVLEGIIYINPKIDKEKNDDNTLKRRRRRRKKTNSRIYTINFLVNNHDILVV